MVHSRARSSDLPPASTGYRRFRIGSRLPLLIGLAVLALAFALLPAAGAAAKRTKVPKTFFGITQGGIVSEVDLQQMHDIKVKTMRLTINWARVEPQKGTFRWNTVDPRVAALARNGIKPAFSVFGSPEWATGSRNLSVPPLKGKAKKAWKKFLKKAVKRYKRHGKFWDENGSLREKPAKSWQIWNEPNLPKYFARKGTSNPVRPVKRTGKSYAKLVKFSDKAIHKADKHAKVILAGLSGHPKKKKLSLPAFFKKFFKVKKIKKHFDAAALHPYAPNLKKYKERISKVRKALKKGGAKKKKLWLTEVGWGSEKDKHGLNKGKRGQAKLLKKSFKVTLKKRKKWRIERLYWFDWRDPRPNAPVLCSFCASAGLLEFDRTPKPSYKKFKRFTKKQGKRIRVG